MIVFTATYVTEPDLDDLRDSIRDVDMEFVATMPSIVARDPLDALMRSLDYIRRDLDELCDAASPSDELMLVIDDVPAADSTHFVHLRNTTYAVIALRSHEI